MMNAPKTLNPTEILLVEDNPGDERLTREALKDAKVWNTLHVARDGLDALDFLYQRRAHTHAPRPDLILLDWHLPGKSGAEVLAEMKADDALKTIPVVILTASHAKEDILKACFLHANFYIEKPVDFVRFPHIVKSIAQLWRTMACGCS